FRRVSSPRLLSPHNHQFWRVQDRSLFLIELEGLFHRQPRTALHRGMLEEKTLLPERSQSRSVCCSRHCLFRREGSCSQGPGPVAIVARAPSFRGASHSLLITRRSSKVAVAWYRVCLK